MSLKFRQKKNTENIAAKFCTACSNTFNAHFVKFLSKSEMVEGEAFIQLTRNDPNTSISCMYVYMAIYYVARHHESRYWWRFQQG